MLVVDACLSEVEEYPASLDACPALNHREEAPKPYVIIILFNVSILTMSAPFSSLPHSDYSC
jgi:hypothetical protein